MRFAKQETQGLTHTYRAHKVCGHVAQRALAQSVCVCVCVCHSDRPSSDAPRLHTSLSTGCVYVRVVKPEKDAFRAYGSVPKGSRGMIDGNKVVDWLAAMQSLRRTNW